MHSTRLSNPSAICLSVRVASFAEVQVGGDAVGREVGGGHREGRTRERMERALLVSINIRNVAAKNARQEEMSGVLVLMGVK